MKTTFSKTDIIAEIAEQSGLTKGDAKKAFDATLDIIARNARQGQVRLPGFGTFERRESKARTGRNPRTGEAIQIAASSRLGFKASPQA